MSVNFVKKIVSIILIVLLISCGGGEATINKSMPKLSGEKAYSKTSNLYVNLPADWFVAEDNECNCIDLWLVKNDYSASISFKKINFNNPGDFENESNEVEEITKYSKAFVSAELEIQFQNLNDEKTFQLNEKIFSAYRYKNQDEYFVRTVVFKHHGKYFECEAVSQNGDTAENLYNLQNTVLSSLN